MASIPSRGIVKDWMDVDAMMAAVPLPEGYRFELLRRSEISALIGFVNAWFPDISVGCASCYLRDDFYLREMQFAGEPQKDFLVVLIKKGHELAGMFSCERDRDALALYARLAVVAPEHRGARLGERCVELAEALGRNLGMGLVYGMATLKTPHVQMALERSGWRLVGITPGYDREMVTPGVVKRVYEAVYAKILVAEEGLLLPRLQNLTPRTKAFFRLLFPEKRLEG